MTRKKGRDGDCAGEISIGPWRALINLEIWAICRSNLEVSGMSKTELIRINRDLSTKLRKAVNDHGFTVRDLVQWILSDVDLDEYAKRLA